MRKSKVIVIGLDGATWRLLTPMMKRKLLPFLSGMIDKGSHGTTKSTIPPITAPAWVTFQTGVNPGKHGIFDFYTYSDGKKKGIVSSRDISVPRFWDILRQEGLRSIIINMPVTYPIEKEQNVVVSSFLTPPGKPYASSTKVQKILEDIGYKIDLPVNRYGVFPKADFSLKEKKQLLKEITELMEKRKEAVEILATNCEWEILFVLFKETDLIQHLFWDGEETTTFYQRLDTLLKKMINNIKKNKNVKYDIILLSDHGFHKSPRWRFSIIKWLYQEGYLKEERNIIYPRGARLYRGIKKLGLDVATIKPLTRLKKIRREKMLNQSRSTFTSQSLIWATSWGLYIDIIKHHSIDQIVDGLKKFKYKGRKIFQMVARRDEIYSGKNIARAPEIVFSPNENFLIDPDPLFEGKMIREAKYPLAGHHYADTKGILIAFGSRIKKNQFVNMDLKDFLPTILSLYDIPNPKWVEGKANIQLLKNKNSSKSTKKKHYNNKGLVTRMIDSEIKKL